MPSLATFAADLLPSVTASCREAGEIALDLFNPGAKTSARIWSKSGGSPVTEADIGVDTFLRVRLSALLPEAAWLSEETVDDARRLTHRLVWVVDPIDGTRAYMNGSPDWAVCIALLAEGEPVLGIVHAPGCAATYAAVTGAGASRNGQAIAATTRPGLTGARIAGPKSMVDLLAQVEAVEAAERVPSLALRLARIADATLDGGLVSRDARDWDIAAADLILREAGGVVTGTRGEPVRYNLPVPMHGELCASGTALAPALRAALDKARDLQVREG